MLRLVLTISLLLVFIPARPGHVSANETVESYFLFMGLGKDALQRRNYDEAIRYFTHAQYLNSQDSTPTQYINYILRLKEEALPVDAYPGPSAPPAVPSPAIRPPGVSSAPAAASAPQSVYPPASRRVVKPESISKPEVRENIYLDAALWARQPRTLIQVELKASVILEGRNIERVLDVTPGFFEINRLDKDKIQLVAVKRGSTLLHIWDDTGRWTFDAAAIIPVDAGALLIERDPVEEYNRNFRVSYSADWGTYYTGRSFDTVKRDSLNFLQTFKVDGETPYGEADGWMVFNKLDDSNELTGYSIGLTDGKIGEFKDFSIRGFDNSKSFSSLSMPGQYIRGVLFDKANILEHFDFSYIRGRDRATFGFLAPEVLQERDAYVEGGRLNYRINEDHAVAFNFARGWGEDRAAFLKDKVYSLTSEHKIEKLKVDAEVAYDEDVTSQTVAAAYKERNYDLSLSLRDINEEFTTITNLPGDRGEAGGLINFGYHWDHVHLSSIVDLYRDRLFFNEDNPDAINLDFSTSVDYRVTDRDRFNASVFYVDTPGELSPRRNFRYIQRYTRNFDFWDNHPLSVFVGNAYQRSRLKFSSSSDYDRHSLSFGWRVPVVKNLDYFWNYEVSRVDEKFTGFDSTPRVMNTGLNYNLKFTEAWYGNAGISYRDEEETEGLNSFLAGEDSITASLGATYRPDNDFEFFTNARLRNIWSESSEIAALNEIDVRWGVRTSWEAPLKWNPKGVVFGRVYNDLNGNGERDPGEAGVPGVKVNVGHQESVTDNKGDYVVEVFAKRVRATLDAASLPKGFVFSDSAVKSIAITAHKWHEADFGVSAQSGVYGVVYFDANENGRPDPADTFVQRVQLTLDKDEVTASDYDGAYFFKNIEPGEHTITLGVNTIPVEYIPQVKVRQIIDVPEGGTVTVHIPLKKK